MSNNDFTPAENAFIDYARNGNFKLDAFTHEAIINALGGQDEDDAKRYIGWVRRELGDLPSYTAPRAVPAEKINTLMTSNDPTRQEILRAVVAAATPAWLRAQGAQEEAKLAETRAKLKPQALIPHALAHGITINAFEWEGIAEKLSQRNMQHLVSVLTEILPENTTIAETTGTLYAGKPITLTASQVETLHSAMGDALFQKLAEGIVAGNARLRAAQQHMQPGGVTNPAFAP